MSRGVGELPVPVRLAAFAVAVVVAGLLGAGLGTMVGPIDVGGDHDEAPASTVSDDGHPSPSSDGSEGGPHG